MSERFRIKSAPFIGFLFGMLIVMAVGWRGVSHGERSREIGEQVLRLYQEQLDLMSDAEVWDTDEKHAKLIGVQDEITQWQGVRSHHRSKAGTYGNIAAIGLATAIAFVVVWLMRVIRPHQS